MARVFANFPVFTLEVPIPIDLNFVTGVYKQLSSTIALTSVLSISRASTGYAKTSAGTLTSFANNTFRITDLGLLTEDARTNSNDNSQNFGTGGYSTGGTSVGSTTNTAPDGTSTATKIVEDTGSGAHNLSKGAGLSAASYTWSVYAKADGRGFAYLQACSNASNRYMVIVNLSTGASSNNTLGTVTGQSSAVETLGNGWYRLQVTLDATASASIVFGLSDSLSPTLGANNYPNYTGDGSSGVQFWGAQVELGSFATSYILTTSASATRAQDVITLTGALASIINALPNSFVVDGIGRQDPGRSAAILGNLSSSVNILTVNTDTQVMSFDGSHFMTGNLGGTTKFSTGVKVAIAQATGDVGIGGGGGTFTDYTFPQTYSNAGFGSCGNPGNQWYGYFRRLSAWDSRLSDSDLQTRTTP